MYIPVGRMVSAGWSPWRRSSRFPSWPSSPWSPPTEGGLTRVWWPPSTGWGFYWFFQFPNQFIINREKQHTADWRQNAAKANRWGLGWLVEDDFTEKESPGPAWDDNCSGRMVREASLSTGRRGRGWSDTGTVYLVHATSTEWKEQTCIARCTMFKKHIPHFLTDLFTDRAAQIRRNQCIDFPGVEQHHSHPRTMDTTMQPCSGFLLIKWYCHDF